MSKRIDLSGLSLFYGRFKAVDDVNMHMEPRSVTAFIASVVLSQISLSSSIADGAPFRLCDISRF